MPLRRFTKHLFFDVVEVRHAGRSWFPFDNKVETSVFLAYFNSNLGDDAESVKNENFKTENVKTENTESEKKSSKKKKLFVGKRMCF